MPSGAPDPVPSPGVSSGSPGAERRPRRRLLKGLLVSVITLTLAFLVIEGSLRYVLFSENMRGTPLARKLRKRQLYAPTSSREYWKLNTLFSGGGTRRGHSCFDWRFGWTTPEFDAVTLAHEDEAQLAGRTPVLLFGDSYADCLNRTLTCWEELMESSELAERYCLLNYGVGGYGLDQAYLLMNAVLPRFAGQDPVVIMGIVVDDDLDRCYVPLRRVPKPYFEVRDGELSLQPVQHTTPREFLDANPVEITSYAWRYLLFGTTVFSRETAVALSSERAHVKKKKEVNRLILEAIWRELGEAGVEGFFLLFHGMESLKSPGPYSWQEPFLYSTFEELGLPFVSSKRYLREYLQRTGAPLTSLFFLDENYNHYKDHGNAAVFPALIDGLQGRFETSDYLGER